MKQDCNHIICGTCKGVKGVKSPFLGGLNDVCSPKCVVATKQNCSCKCGGQFHQGNNSRLLSTYENRERYAAKKVKKAKKENREASTATKAAKKAVKRFRIVEEEILNPDQKNDIQVEKRGLYRFGPFKFTYNLQGWGDGRFVWIYIKFSEPKEKTFSYPTYDKAIKEETWEMIRDFVSKHSKDLDEFNDTWAGFKKILPLINSDGMDFKKRLSAKKKALSGVSTFGKKVDQKIKAIIKTK